MAALRGVTGGGRDPSDCRGSTIDVALLLDIEDGGRQLPNTASRNAEAVGEGAEYSETDIDGRPDGIEIVMDGRAPLSSTSVSIGVRNDMLSSEYLESLSVRDLVNEGIPSRLRGAGDKPRWISGCSGIGGGDSEETTRRALASLELDILGVEAAFRTVWNVASEEPEEGPLAFEMLSGRSGSEREYNGFTSCLRGGGAKGVCTCAGVSARTGGSAAVSSGCSRAFGDLSRNEGGPVFGAGST